jgi:superfamily I DNA/RNA helicase
MGKERIATLVNNSESKSRPLWESLQAFVSGGLRFPQNDQGAERALTNLVRTLGCARQQLAANLIPNVAELIDFVRDKVNYDDHLKKKFGPEADERIGNLEELKNFAGEIERITEDNQLPDIGGEEETRVEESPLERFLGNISLMTDVRDSGDDKIDSVRPSTTFVEL